VIRLPKSPEERRAAKAARQKRWRDRAKAKQQIDHQVNRALGQPAQTKIVPLSKTDAAAYVKDALMGALAGRSGELLLDKDIQPAIANLLRAEGQIEAREKAKAKSGDAEFAMALFRFITGQAPRTPQIEDGMTIEGEAVELATE